MKYNFDFPDTGDEDRRVVKLSPKQEVEWLPLQDHPAFQTCSSTAGEAAERDGYNRGISQSLMAWDGASRLYFWDRNRKCLHRISIRPGEPDSTSVLAASPSKVLQADVELNFVVDKISLNKNKSALVLAGSEGLSIMHLYGHSSTEGGAIICRTVSVGLAIYFSERNVLRILQISWHPYSSTHLGILSADSVFRLFDLSSDVDQPEQEYYLQPVEPGRLRNAASICAVDFSFGLDHLWDRFSVFVLFSDGSIYILCPVVPFGSLHKRESILAIYTEARTFGVKTSNSQTVINSNLAISWLESVFPKLTQGVAEGGNFFELIAQPYAVYDASVLLQGPLRKVSHDGEEDSKIQAAECEGHAISFLYNSFYKDSVLVTAWSGGQLQIDALVDEIQPHWAVGRSPHLSLDSHGQIMKLGMICEPLPIDASAVKLDQPLDHSFCFGHSPPLLRLAIVDLGLPKNSERSYTISLFVDPLYWWRMYCLHYGGLDAIVLHFLPFTCQNSGIEEAVKTPSVHTVINACPGESSLSSPLCGFVALSDSFGKSWIVGLTFSHECIVLDTETRNLFSPPTIGEDSKPFGLEGKKKTDSQTIISKELLVGPKSVVLPPSSQNLRSVAADTIEGRSILHQYFNLFHENYVDYAHKVFIELKGHAPHLKKIIDDQHSSIQKIQQKLVKAEEKQEKVVHRIDSIVQVQSCLEDRLQNLRNLPGLNKKPLTKAEQDFKLELERFVGTELDALCSSIEAMKARLQRYTHSPRRDLPNRGRHTLARRKTHAEDDEISQLKSSIEKLSLVNSENTKKVKLIEDALRNRELSSS